MPTSMIGRPSTTSVSVVASCSGGTSLGSNTAHCIAWSSDSSTATKDGRALTSCHRGRPAGGNPWRATTLEWQTPETPPPHGNFGKDLPVVYRWAYDYSVPGADQDFLPQNQPGIARIVTGSPHG